MKYLPGASLFSQELLAKATATPEQIEKAKKDGVRFRFEDKTGRIVISGFNLNGIVYITDIKNNQETAPLIAVW